MEVLRGQPAVHPDRARQLEMASRDESKPDGQNPAGADRAGRLRNVDRAFKFLGPEQKAVRSVREMQEGKSGCYVCGGTHFWRDRRTGWRCEQLRRRPQQQRASPAPLSYAGAAARRAEQREDQRHDQQVPDRRLVAIAAPDGQRLAAAEEKIKALEQQLVQQMQSARQADETRAKQQEEQRAAAAQAAESQQKEAAAQQAQLVAKLERLEKLLAERKEDTHVAQLQQQMAKQQAEMDQLRAENQQLQKQMSDMAQHDTKKALKEIAEALKQESWPTYRSSLRSREPAGTDDQHCRAAAARPAGAARRRLRQDARHASECGSRDCETQEAGGGDDAANRLLAENIVRLLQAGRCPARPRKLPVRSGSGPSFTPLPAT